MGRGRSATIALAFVVATAATTTVTVAPSTRIPTGHAGAAPATARFAAVAPTRLADTRQSECGCVRPSPHVVRVQVAGRGGVPEDAIAAAITVTSDRAGAAGYITVAPSGTERPDTSVVNVEPGVARANSSVVALGADGAIELFLSAPTDVIVDVTGAFVAAGSATSGRFVSSEPRRLLDTRSGPALPAGGSVAVGRPGDVAADAIAVVVNVTAVSAPEAGYVSAHAAGAARADTSMLNVAAGEPARAATAIVPVSADGFSLWTSAGGHLLADIVGWFTGPGAARSEAGLFVPMQPTRALDTRAQRPRIHAGGALELAAPAGAQAVVTNVTATRTDAAGFITAQPAGTPRAEVSALNPAGFDTTVANLTITAASTRGTAYFSSSGADLVVDLTGYFTGDPMPAALPPAPNTPPPTTALLVGDSSLAGVRWYGQSTAALQGFVAVLDAESCRRLSTPSCIGREDRAPSNAVEAILSHRMWFDTVVVQVGYNDWFDDFPAMLGEVMNAARARGARHVVWMTYRDSGTASSETAKRAYRANNVALAAVAASGAHPDLVVADWNAYTATVANQWFVSDGVHFTLAGAYGAADYIARWVAHLAGASCPQPRTLGGAVDDPCPAPDGHAPPDVMALYGAQPSEVHCYEVGDERAVVCRRDTLLP